MKIEYIAIFLLISIIGCTHHKTGEQKNDSYQNVSKLLTDYTSNEFAFESKILSNKVIVEEDSITIPDFEIEVLFSLSAISKIKQENESVIVNAYFSGIPKDTLTEAYKKWGEVIIGVHSIELWNSKIAYFKNVKVHKKAIEALTDSNFNVVINVFSGRHSSISNLLDCEILEGDINEIKGIRHQLKCKLIYSE